MTRDGYDAVDQALATNEHPHDILGALVDATSVAAIIDVLVRDYYAEVQRVFRLVHTCPVCRIHYVPLDDEDACDPRYCSATCAREASTGCEHCGQAGQTCVCP